MKKKIIIILSLVLVIILLLVSTVTKNKYNKDEEKMNLTEVRQKDNETDRENKIEENEINTIKNNDLKKETTTEGNINQENIRKSSLPSDVGLTVDGIPKTLNQDIMSKANIAYLLGCDDITDSTDLEGYINKHMPKNGIFISERSIYKKDPDNPYDFLKERKDIMKDNLATINLNYDIDSNNYLINNKKNGELEKKLNKLISGDKKIIIGFVADYYSYINDTEYGLEMGGSFDNYDYVSFKPYNNIYAYIFDENSARMDDFYSMIEEISNLAE